VSTTTKWFALTNKMAFLEIAAKRAYCVGHSIILPLLLNCEDEWRSAKWGRMMPQKFTRHQIQQLFPLMTLSMLVVRLDRSGRGGVLRCCCSVSGHADTCDARYNNVESSSVSCSCRLPALHSSPSRALSSHWLPVPTSTLLFSPSISLLSLQSSCTLYTSLTVIYYNVANCPCAMLSGKYFSLIGCN